MSILPTRPLAFFCTHFFFTHTATTEIYPLSLHDALPISQQPHQRISDAEARGDRHPDAPLAPAQHARAAGARSEEHTSELQSLRHLVCRLLLEKKKKNKIQQNKT